MTRLLYLFLLCTVVTLCSYVLVARFDSERALIDYLPDDTLAVVACDRVAWAKDDMHGSSVALSRNAKTWLRLLQRAGCDDALISAVRNTFSLCEKYATHPAVSFLTEHSAIFALLPDFDSQSSFSLDHQWLLVFRADTTDVSNQLAQILGGIRFQQHLSYHGEAIAHIALPSGIELFCWQSGSAYLVAGQQALIRRCIDLNRQQMVKTDVGIRSNPAFCRLRLADATPGSLYGYVDCARLLALLTQSQILEQTSDHLIPDQVAIRYNTSSGKHGIEITALADHDSMVSFRGRHRLPPLIRLPSLQTPSPETGVAFWTNWFNLKDFWDYGLQQSQGDLAPLLYAIGQQITEGTGKSMDDFFNAFGGEFGVLATEQPADLQSSRFLGCLVMTVRDRATVAAMLKQLVAGLQVVTVRSDNVDIVTVALAGGLLRPAYALLGDHLILADSADLVELARRQLLPDHDQKNASSRAAERDDRGNLVFFVRTGEIADRLLPVLSQLARETGEWNGLLSAESRQLIREIGMPVLASLHNVAASWLRGYIENDAIHVKLDYTLRAN